MYYVPVQYVQSVMRVVMIIDEIMAENDMMEDEPKKIILYFNTPLKWTNII